MKKLISILSVILIIVCVVAFIPVFSADTDFVIEDGVLLSYDGESTSVTIPSSVRVISAEAFVNNTKLTSLKLGTSVYSIGDRAFYGCTSLKSVSGGDNIKYVGALAFFDTPYLTQSDVEYVTIGSALLCYNGTSSAVTLPENISTVSPYAFLRNDNITSFTAGEQLTSIAEGAFYECTKLGEVSVTNNVSFIGADAFKGTAWLDAQPDFVVLGDSVLVSYNGSSTDVSVPEGVKQIAANAFYENAFVSSVKLPTSVFAIGERAFMSCSSLNDIRLNSGLVMIDNEAFANCTKLTSVTTPLTLSKLGKGAFVNCSKLRKAFVRGNNLIIDYGAFAYCNSLEVVLLSSDVASVGNDAFSHDSSLRYVTVPPEIISVTSQAFTNSDLLTVICDKDSFADTALSGNVPLDYNRGDSNIDGKVDILDATTVQMYIASLSQTPDVNLAYMDADFDADITILDTTYIQLLIAKLL